MRRGPLSIALFVAAAMSVFPMQKAKTSSKPAQDPPRQTLSEEEKEILRQRELLENLDLLQNFEKVQYMNFLAEKKPAKSKEKQPVKVQTKSNEQKSVAP